MSLTDDIIEAEQRAREECQRLWEAQAQAKIGQYADVAAALDRYAAVCRLAGRWEQISNAYVGSVADIEARVRRELARLMEDCR